MFTRRAPNAIIKLCYIFVNGPDLKMHVEILGGSPKTLGPKIAHFQVLFRRRRDLSAYIFEMKCAIEKMKKNVFQLRGVLYIPPKFGEFWPTNISVCGPKFTNTLTVCSAPNMLMITESAKATSSHIQGGSKMAPFFYALILPNINAFSKLFHCQNQEKICSNTKDPTAPQVFRYTTL